MNTVNNETEEFRQWILGLDNEKLLNQQIIERNRSNWSKNTKVLYMERRELHSYDDLMKYYDVISSLSKKDTDIGVESRTEREIHDIQVHGNIAFVASRVTYFRKTPDGKEKEDDSFRLTDIFEKADGRWQKVHGHASFQAPTGPQRKVPLKTDPGFAWSPVLEGGWKSKEEEWLATRTNLLVLSLENSNLGGSWKYEEVDGMLRLTNDKTEICVKIVSLSHEVLAIENQGKIVTFNRISGP